MEGEGEGAGEGVKEVEGEGVDKWGESTVRLRVWVQTRANAFCFEQ